MPIFNSAIRQFFHSTIRARLPTPGAVSISLVASARAASRAHNCSSMRFSKNASGSSISTGYSSSAASSNTSGGSATTSGRRVCAARQLLQPQSLLPQPLRQRHLRQRRQRPQVAHSPALQRLQNFRPWCGTASLRVTLEMHGTVLAIASIGSPTGHWPLTTRCRAELLPTVLPAAPPLCLPRSRSRRQTRAPPAPPCPHSTPPQRSLPAPSPNNAAPHRAPSWPAAPKIRSSPPGRAPPCPPPCLPRAAKIRRRSPAVPHAPPPPAPPTSAGWLPATCSSATSSIWKFLVGPGASPGLHSISSRMLEAAGALARGCTAFCDSKPGTRASLSIRVTMRSIDPPPPASSFPARLPPAPPAH